MLRDSVRRSACLGDMVRRVPLIALALAATSVCLPARAADEGKYPDMRGAWERAAGAQWDATKPGRKQQAPLTAEFQKVFEANLADQDSGGQEYNPQVVCLPSGMPRVMIAYEPLEMIITPEVTYLRFDQMGEFRRIYTDGRAWPDTITPSFDGYSIGKWVDPDASGRFTALQAETRGMRGPRTIDASGIPVHPDNETIVQERFYLDAADHDLLHDRVTTIDHAFSRPWTVVRDFRRIEHVPWVETNCDAENHYVWIGQETYFISVDGFLMPTKKDQPAPDLKNFAR